jgi:hypothetical protein
MPHNSFDEIQSPARAQGLCVHRFDGWLAINRNSTDNPRIASSLGSWSATLTLGLLQDRLLPEDELFRPGNAHGRGGIDDGSFFS